MEIKKEVCRGGELCGGAGEKLWQTLAFGSAVHGRVSYRNTASVAFWMTGGEKKRPDI